MGGWIVPPFITLIMDNYKHYMAFKPCKEPHVLCKIDCRPFVDMTEEVGIHYFEDEIGYYIKSGELIVNAT